MVLGLNNQLCLGQKCGLEYAIHTLRKQYEKTNSDAILLIDAESAFNSLNRNQGLKKIAIICPSILPAIQNSCFNPSKLFIHKNVILSREGTTQEDPLALAMYGLATLPLMKLVNINSLTQKWYADGGNLKSLQRVLDNIIKHGKHFGYHVKASKCQLLVKDEKNIEAIKVFKNTKIEMKKRARVLGSVIGSGTKCKTFLETQLEEHDKIMKKLCMIAKTSIQKLYSCYTKGVQENYRFELELRPIPQKICMPARRYCRKISFQI